MYNRWTSQKELTPEQMRLVRKGFRRLLARGKYRPEFIVNNPVWLTFGQEDQQSPSAVGENNPT